MNKENKKIKVVYIQTKRDCPFDVIEIENNLETFQKLIGSKTIDFVKREVDGELLFFICDKEGLLKNNPRVSAVWYPSGKSAFVGNLIIVGRPDEFGKLKGLTTKQAKKVVRQQKTATVFGEGKRFFIILDEEKNSELKMTFSCNMESKEGE